MWGEWSPFDDCPHECPRFKNGTDTWVKRRERSKTTREKCNGKCEGKDVEHLPCSRVADMTNEIVNLKKKIEEATTTTTTQANENTALYPSSEFSFKF